MQKILRTKLNNFLMTGNRLNKRVLSFLLSVLLIIYIIPSYTLVKSVDETYFKPKKISAIDNSISDRSDDPKTSDINEEWSNSAWFTGKNSNKILERYYNNPAYEINENPTTEDEFNAFKEKLGSEACPYLIETGLEMAYLASLVNSGNNFSNKYIKIIGSNKDGSEQKYIDLITTGGILYQASSTTVGWVPCDENNKNLTGWIPIGTSSTNCFNGNIDAEGVKIYNLSANMATGTAIFGLFGYLGTNAVIKNINLFDVQIYNGNTGVGANIGALAGNCASLVTIENCSATGIAVGNRDKTANGSLIQVTTNNSDYFNGSYKVPDFTIYSNGRYTSGIGGIIGIISNSADKNTDNNTILNNIAFNGSIVVNLISEIGGIIGKISYPKANSNIRITNISGDIKIRTISEFSGFMYRVGGVLGYVFIHKNDTANVYISDVGTETKPFNVKLYGAAFNQDDSSNIRGGFGGIVGTSATDPEGKSLKLDISNSYVTLEAGLNKKDNSKDNSKDNNFYIGGILGRSSGSSESILKIKNCNVINSKISRTADTKVNQSTKITMGGIVGAVDAYNADNAIIDCTVDNFKFSTDGLTGGIIGIGKTASSCNVANIDNCVVKNCEFTQSYQRVNDSDVIYAIIGGIAAGVNNGNKITNCEVKNVTYNFVSSFFTGSYNILGGIAGKSEGSEITNCIADIIYNIGSSNSNTGILNPTGIFAGGICGYSSNTTINNSISVIDYNSVTTVTNTIEPTNVTFKLFPEENPQVQNVIMGGITAYAQDSVTINNSFTSGDFNAVYDTTVDLGDRQNAIGGLVGVINGTGFSMENCFSTASLNGNLEDTIGGLIGFNAVAEEDSDTNPKVKVSNCHFGGTLLNPNAASIVNYSLSGNSSTNFTGITYNQKMSPNSPSAGGNISAEPSETVPYVIENVTSNLNNDYYMAATVDLFSFNGNHVFAVNDNLVDNADYEIKEKESVSNNVSITRRVKFVRNLIDSAEDGIKTAFLISDSNDLSKMQAYVAAGGGFLGSKYELTADISSDLTEPIGMASDDVKRADENNQPFCGVFDGKTKTITFTADKSAQSYNGVFGYIQNATINNLNVVYSGSRTVNAVLYSGGVVGYAAYSDINNVNVTANDGLKLNGTASGGIIGYCKASTVNSINNTLSSFNGKLMGASNLGGIIGIISNTKPTFLIHNAGGGNFTPLFNTIKLTYTKAALAKITNCSVSGDIIGYSAKSTTDATNVATSIGGLVGCAQGEKSQIDSSFMFGNVKGGSEVGGLIGTIKTIPDTVITNSYMNGDVYAENFAGGIVGKAENTSDTIPIIQNGYFVGQIECKGAFGALTSSNAIYDKFVYDIQIAGNLPITGNTEEDNNVEKTISGIRDTLPVKTEIVNKESTILINTSEYTSNIAFYYNGIITKSLNKTSTSTADTSEWRVSTKTNDERFLIKTSATPVRSDITFSGYKFTLNDYVSLNACMLKISIDGNFISINDATKLTTLTDNLNSEFDWYQYSNSDFTVTFAWKKDASLNGEYTAFPAASLSSNACDTVFITFNNNKNSNHKISMEADTTNTGKFFTFYGFTYATVAETTIETDNTFTINDSNYPQLTVFFDNAKYKEISKLSTEYIYDFTENINNVSNAFKGTTNIIKVNSQNYITDKTETELKELGIQKNGNVYTNSSIGIGGNYKYTVTRTVNGYSLSIDEKIVVIPFENGFGTENDPFQIRNVKELIIFRNFINNTYSGAGLFFKLTMDNSSPETATPAHSIDGNIYDLSGADQHDCGENNVWKESAADWDNPIGNETNKFQGYFDGNGKTISNFDVSTLKQENTAYNGLFGYISDADIKNLTIKGDFKPNNALSYNNNIYFGGIAAVCDNSTIENCAASIEINVETSGTSSIGGFVGSLSGNSVLKGLLSDNKITATANSVGNIIGGADLAYSNANMQITDCISYGTIITNNSMACTGGIIGQIANNITAGTILLQNNAFYGSINLYRGYAGSIVGSSLLTNGGYINLENNISTASISVGNSSYNDTDITAGGIMGSSKSGTNYLTMNGNVFGGEIVAVNNGKAFKVGGLIGLSDYLINTNSKGNYYDATKNPGLNNNGNTKTDFQSLFSIDYKDFNGAMMTSNLLDNTIGTYRVPVFENTVTFGSADNTKLSGLIIEANSTSLNLVRVDNVYDLGKADLHSSLTSAFVSSGNMASIKIDNYQEASQYYEVTTNNKRVVSTNTNITDTITIQLVKNDGESSDVFRGYGKKLTYYPSIKSIGKTDVSYLCANNDGDGINGVAGEKAYTIYNADQLMGLDVLVTQLQNDTFGNRVYKTIDSGYSIYLANDIDFKSLDYINITSDTSTNTMIIGDSDNHFKGTFNGQYHIIYNAQTRANETNVGLFAYLDGAIIKNTGITDSVFAGTKSNAETPMPFTGSVGSFAGTAVNSSFIECFSSTRVEQDNVMPENVYIGGLVGSIGTTDFKDCFFTGSVGITATDNSAYPSISGDGNYYSGGFAGIANGTVGITDSYVASYINGDITADADSNSKQHNIGLFIAKGGDNVTLTNCNYDETAKSESCYAIGDKPSETVSSFDKEIIEYPSKWGTNLQSLREKTARIRVSFSTSASSMSRAEIKSGSFSKDDYNGSSTVWGTNTVPLYNISDDKMTATRANSGISSIVVTNTDDGIISQRLIMMNLQCWYDNYTIENEKKVYTIKNASDLTELAQMVLDGNENNVGHSHSVNHDEPGVATDRFNNAIIKLGNNITITDNVFATIGTSTATAFAGTFDGNGYTISNASFIGSNGIAGLFGYITNTAVIENVSLSGNSTVTIPNTENGEVYVGGIVANYTNGSVRNCSNGANITVINNSVATVYVGGITGVTGADRSIEYCYNMGHITAASNGMNISGISGKNLGMIIHCYNTGIIDGNFDSLSADFVYNTSVGGISALNIGSISECYNAGILRYGADGRSYPIADGTVTHSYVDGRYFMLQYKFVSGVEYSAGTKVLSTEEMTGNTAFDSTWGNDWIYINGYYPQFKYITDGNSSGKKASSTASAIAGILTKRNDETATFDCFRAVDFNYGVSKIAIIPDKNNLGTFSVSESTQSIKYTVTKRGAATFYVNCDSGDVTYTRQMYYINENTFNVSYMFDFSELVNNTDEAQIKPINTTVSTDDGDKIITQEISTFADNNTRSIYGNGSAGKPYLINTVNDLTAFSTYINSLKNGGKERYFKLIRNIDCTGIDDWMPIGTEDNPFEGNFNGNGYIISGIISSNKQYNGLFGKAGMYSTIELVAVKDSMFYAQTGNNSGSWTGTIAGYTDGVISNCYTRSRVNIPTSNDDAYIYAGGIAGELGQNGIIRGCYARPARMTGNNVEAGYNTIVCYNTSKNLICGILVGKTSGIIDGCYHTCVYYEPTDVSSVNYAIIAGEFAAGEINNTYYDINLIPATDKKLFLKYGELSGGISAVEGNEYSKTTEQLKTTEKSASTDGVANDSMALILSKNIYLGTYEMTGLKNESGNTNDGYPMLTAFDLSQYEFKSFTSSNLILCMQNADASTAKLMNSLGTYESYRFPVYADIIAKTKLNISVYSLPYNISYNVSAVGYGHDETGDIKWTCVNGEYTNSRELYKDILDNDNNILSTAHGRLDNETEEDALNYIKNSNNGSISVAMGDTRRIPSDCDKLYVYITLLRYENVTDKWGVYHTWDSSTLQELPPESETE